MPEVLSLSHATRHRLLAVMLESRHCCIREESLNRQGKGHFHISGQGHEAFACAGMLMEPDDYACPFYRDRGLVLGRGVTVEQLALDYMAKRGSTSFGRQLPSHYSHRKLNLWSVPTPTALQLLPACGIAWGMQLDGKKNLVIACVGDASTRQGDFYEAINFARERKLPLLFIVQDNGYGISTPTRARNPLALHTLDEDEWTSLDGWDVEQVHRTVSEAMDQIRRGSGPRFLWAKLERLASHTSSDDQKIYRSAEELATLSERDPILVLKGQMVADGILTEEQFTELDQKTKERVRQAYLDADHAEDPSPDEVTKSLFGPLPEIDEEVLKPGHYRIGDVVNQVLRAGLDADPRRLIFGEDVEDPKGGVFKLTKKLSTDFPAQVFNSPLAESTILGIACGLASYGKRPVFEVQFIDFIYPGWNQLVSNLATLRWRTDGDWTCPAVIYAPYGAYLPGGSIWHSQANESAFAHFPGLNVVVPSTPEDAAGLLWTAMHASDPVIVLIPKHLLWAECDLSVPARSVPLGKARLCQPGIDLTLVAWGNTMEKAREAIERLGDTASIELIDLRSIVPLDLDTIGQSVAKTGRLVVVQEDTESCSVAQKIVSRITGAPDLWPTLKAPPAIVSTGDVLIGYNPIFEYAALPSTDQVVQAIQRSLAMNDDHVALAMLPVEPGPSSRPDAILSEPPRKGDADEIAIQVPVMGEGIRSARVVTLRKNPGHPVRVDDTLCEVETDKAVYPIEASFAGTLSHWHVKVGDTVTIGQEIGVIASTAAPRSANLPARPTAPVPAKIQPDPQPATVSGESRPPALSPAITRRLEHVIPTNILLKAPWKAIRAARESAKRNGSGDTVTPSLILAWCVTRAMEKHAAFRCLISSEGTITEQRDFDVGFAVALPGDLLATAVVRKAGSLSWDAFCDAYHAALTATRAGKIEELRTPVNLSSLGAFGVESAMPIVVPPAVATLFIGSAHEQMINDGGVVYPAEVVTLSLTFDHRVVNGAGGAAFLRDVRNHLETFVFPSTSAAPAVVDSRTRPDLVPG